MANTLQFWESGAPMSGGENSSIITMQYWDSGFAYNYITPDSRSGNFFFFFL